MNVGWTTACSGMLERDGKDQGEDSPKQAGSCGFARPCTRVSFSEMMSLFPSMLKLYHFRFLFVWRVRRTFFPPEYVKK